MLHFTLTHSRLHKLKLATANLAIVVLTLITFSPTAYADAKAPADRNDLIPVVVSGVDSDSTQKTLDKLQQLAASTMQTSSAVDLPEIEVDDFWATSQSTLDKVAEAKRKAAIEKRKAAKAKRLQALATAPTGVIQAYAHQQVLANSWGEGDFTCLVNLWNKESGWDPKAENISSGAYGIPQSLPGNKMAAAGANWKSDYRVQINWGISYIAASYGTPCAAWSHSQAHNFY